jgi:hypothetical protein
MSCRPSGVVAALLKARSDGKRSLKTFRLCFAGNWRSPLVTTYSRRDRGDGGGSEGCETVPRARALQCSWTDVNTVVGSAAGKIGKYEADGDWKILL